MNHPTDRVSERWSAAVAATRTVLMGLAVLVSLAVLLGPAGCGGRPAAPPVKDLEFTQSMSSARLAFERGQMAQAVLLFEQAMRKASARDDAADIGEAAYNLGVCLFDDGQLDRAAAALETARIELARAGSRTTDVRLVQAKLAHKAQPASSDAFAIAEAVVAAKDVTAAERCQALTLLAGIDLDAGRVEKAGPRTEAARRALPSVGAAGVSPESRNAMAAGIAGLDARLALARGDHANAAVAFDRQAELAQAGGLYAEMSAALVSAGHAYGKTDNHASSADRLFRAARSLLAQGDPVRGDPAAKDAAAAAGRAGDPTLAARARSLVAEPVTQPATLPATQSR